MTTGPPDFVALKRRYNNDQSFSPGARAELRHVDDPEELAFRPALYRLFSGQRPNVRHMRLAYLLPYCEHSTNVKSLGMQLAEANVAEARLQQVVRSDAPLDMKQLRRLLIQLIHIDPKAKVDWSQFGRMVWYWKKHDKRQLVEDFYIAHSALK